MGSVQGKIATLVDPKRKVLALYIMRTGLFKQTPGISKSIADLHNKVDSCVRDFIVVYDSDEIMVIVDTNQPRKDQAAFHELTQQIRLLLAKDGATYKEVDYPTTPEYDPRMIYDDEGYGGYKVARKRRFFRPR